jgi:hypothetical protein
MARGEASELRGQNLDAQEGQTREDSDGASRLSKQSLDDKEGHTGDDSGAAEPSFPRRGFLPIETNLFDRVFIAVVSFVALHLVWMRLLEAILPLWIGTAIAIGLGGLIVSRG